MDSVTNKSGEDVDTNDSDLNRTLPQNVKRKYNISTSSSSTASSENVAASSLPVPPDGGWGWVVVMASFMINFIADGVSLSFGVLFIDFVDYFGASKAKTSWVGSIFLSMPLLAGPIASYLIDRYGCRKMCIIGALLSASSFILSIGAFSLEFLFFTFSITGLGLALCYVASIVIVAYYFEKRRSLATGLAACGTGIGTFLFPPFTTYLLEQYSWRGTLLILSGFFLNMAVFGALMRDLDVPSAPKVTKHEENCDNCCAAEQRLCSSMLQLPTYLENSCPEVISELSSKEGTYLNSLLEQHPYILDAILTKNPAVVEKKAKRPSRRGANRSLTPGESSLSARLDANYLRNMKMQRGSITYRGAMLNIKRYRLKASSCPDIFRNSMVTISEEKSCLFLHDLKVLMKEMFDFSNFKNIGYTVFCISNFLLYACVDIPYVYIPDHAHTNGIDIEWASFLISILGFLNCLGVVIVGFIGDKPWIDPSLLYSCFIFISGVSLALLPAFLDYYVTATLAGVYGFTISANYTLVPVIIVNLISLDSFTGAYGLLLLVQGVASLIGPPAAGAIFDMTGHYSISFFSTGLIIIISGIMFIPVSKNICSRKSSSIISKDSMTSVSRRVKFEEPEDKDAIDPASKAVIRKDGGNYSIKENAENSVPLLSDEKAGISLIVDVENRKSSMYENPLSIV